MSTINSNYNDDNEWMQEFEYHRHLNWQSGQLRKKSRKHTQSEPKRNPPTQLAQENKFEFSYNASHHERDWIYQALGPFHEQHWIDDVHRLIKGGKEASVYLCPGNETSGLPFLAAKIYRPRRFRNLRKDHVYRAGRDRLNADGHIIHDDRMLNAIRKRTMYGQQLLHSSWIEHEYQSMKLLHELDADIPQPFARGNNAILMEYIGDEDLAAPTLNSVRLATRTAKILFERTLHNVELMLSIDRIHADLSAYNILYWEGNIKLIDFPQIISTRKNLNAFPIFRRDMVRICEYFQRQGVDVDGARLAHSMWQARDLPFTIEPDLKRLIDPDELVDEETG